MSTIQIIADDRESQSGVIEAVLTADEQALLAVAGIGAKRAKSIRWAVGERWTSYSTINPPA